MRNQVMPDSSTFGAEEIELLSWLRDNYWSEENIGLVIGASRPAVHNHKLSVEQTAKLVALANLRMTFRAFSREAIREYAWQHVSREAYKNLATVTTTASPDSETTLEVEKNVTDGDERSSDD